MLTKKEDIPSSEPEKFSTEFRLAGRSFSLDMGELALGLSAGLLTLSREVPRSSEHSPANGRGRPPRRR